MENENQQAQKAPSPWMELVFNLVLPSVIMIKGSKEEYLGPVWGLVVALAFPLGYGIYDFYRQKKVNGISVLGLISVFLTGGFTLLELDAHWMAVKEAAIPGIIGLVVLISLKTKTPLIRKFLLNDSVVDTARIEAALQKQGTKSAFDSRLVQSTWLLASSFFVSAILNYGLAKWILKSEPGTAEYTEELGKMTALSYPVIMVPSLLMMAFTLWFLFGGIRKLTGLELADLMHKHS